MILNELIRSLPHTYPMLMIDRVVLIEGKTTITKNEIKRSNPFVDKNNVLSELAYIELMAQTSGVFLEYQNRQLGDGYHSALGFLMSVSSFEIFDSLKVEDEVEVTARLENGIDNYFIFKCNVRKGDKIISTGEIKIYAQYWDL